VDRWITAIAMKGWFNGDLAEIFPSGDGWRGTVKYEIFELKEWVEVYTWIIRPVWQPERYVPIEYKVWDYFPQVHETQFAELNELKGIKTRRKYLPSNYPPYIFQEEDVPITKLLDKDTRTTQRVAFAYSSSDPVQHYIELPPGERLYLQLRRFILSSSFAECDLLAITDIHIDNDEVINCVDYFFVFARALHEDACGVKWMSVEMMRERKDALDKIVVPTDVIVPESFHCSVAIDPELGAGMFLPMQLFPRFITFIAKRNNEFLQPFPTLSFAHLSYVNPAQEALSIYKSSTFMRCWAIPDDFYFAEKLSSTIGRDRDIPACVFDYGQNVNFERIESSETVKRQEFMSPDYVYDVVVEVKLSYIYTPQINRIVFPRMLIVPYFFPAKSVDVKMSALGAVSVNIKPFEHRHSGYYASSPPYTYQATVSPQFRFYEMPPWENDYFVGGEIVKWLSLIGTRYS